MKKYLFMLLILLTFLCMACSSQKDKEIEKKSINVSNGLTFYELVDKYSSEYNVDAEMAKKTLKKKIFRDNKITQKEDMMFREIIIPFQYEDKALQLRLYVDSNWDQVKNASAIYNADLIYNNAVMDNKFSGYITLWIRDNDFVEYNVHGEIYKELENNNSILKRKENEFTVTYAINDDTGIMKKLSPEFYIDQHDTVYKK